MLVVTGVLFFNQPITGRGKPLALQNRVTMAMPSSMNSKALFGWIEKAGLQNTEIQIYERELHLSSVRNTVKFRL